MVARCVWCSGATAGCTAASNSKAGCGNAGAAALGSAAALGGAAVGREACVVLSSSSCRARDPACGSASSEAALLAL